MSKPDALTNADVSGTTNAKKHKKPKGKPDPKNNLDAPATNHNRNVTFTEDAAADGNTFEAGQAYDLRADSAWRWVRRGVAYYTEDGNPNPPAPAADPAE